MHSIPDIVGKFSLLDQQDALSSIYDQNYFESLTDNELAFMAQIDREVQRFLHLLAENDWDFTMAYFKWTEKDVF
jgi:hypothetical protein